MKNTVSYTGEEGKIVLPKGMTLEAAVSALEAESELATYGEAIIKVEETISRFPFEAAYGLARAIEEIHGASIQHDKQLSNGSIIEAKLIGIPISPTETVQVPWGPFRLPDVEGDLETTLAEENGMVVMKIAAKIKRKYRGEIEMLAKRTREILQRESIYRGKAIKVRFRDEKGGLSIAPPTFMDLGTTHTAIFSEEVQRELDTNLLIPIKHPEGLKRLKIPSKRGILLQGTYGSGKTLLAYTIAKVATEAGRTFIYVENAAELPDALSFGAMYSPAVVFAEDIDRITIGTRTLGMDRLLNRVDGVDTKNSDIITVLTTNNLDLIHPAFIREGRMDAVIRIDSPDRPAIEALVRHFGGDLINAKVDLGGLSHRMIGKTPAFIREVVESSKLELLRAIDVDGNGDGELHLSAQDLEIAFHRHEKQRDGIETAMHEGEMLRTIVNQMASVGRDVGAVTA